MNSNGLIAINKKVIDLSRCGLVWYDTTDDVVIKGKEFDIVLENKNIYKRQFYFDELRHEFFCWYWSDVFNQWIEINEKTNNILKGSFRGCGNTVPKYFDR